MDKYVSIPQYAKLCKVTTTTIYNRLKDGEVKIADVETDYKFDLINTEDYPPKPKKKNGRKPFNMDMIK
jgi:hypothetical protein